MNIWESGRATEHIQDIIAGTKTLEGRLNRSKFAKYKPGDIINLREDVYDNNGKKVKEIKNKVTVKITKIGAYPDFETMLEQVGYKSALPRASSLSDAINTYRKYYPPTDEQKCGVLAIHITVIPLNSITLV